MKTIFGYALCVSKFVFCHEGAKARRFSVFRYLFSVMRYVLGISKFVFSHEGAKARRFLLSILRFGFYVLGFGFWVLIVGTERICSDRLVESLRGTKQLYLVMNYTRFGLEF